MALELFRPPVGPSPGNTYKPTVNLWEAEFGDGYSQPTPKGINHIKKTLSYSWNALTREQALEIEEFFMRHQGVKPFYYKPFGEDRVMKFTCKEWQKNDESGIWKFTATFVQSFSHEV